MLNCECEKLNNTCLHRVTRFEDVYSGRRRALSKLDTINRDYGEIVAIRYYLSDPGKPNFILAFYKSQAVGDYQIIYDSGDTENNKYSNSRVFEVEDPDNTKTIEENIENEYANEGLIPKIGDLFRLSGTLYIYLNGDWVVLSEGFGTENTKTVTLELNKDEIWNRIILKASVPFDEDNFRIEDNKVSIKRIDGGNA